MPAKAYLKSKRTVKSGWDEINIYPRVRLSLECQNICHLSVYHYLAPDLLFLACPSPEASCQQGEFSSLPDHSSMACTVSAHLSLPDTLVTANMWPNFTSAGVSVSPHAALLISGTATLCRHQLLVKRPLAIAKLTQILYVAAELAAYFSVFFSAKTWFSQNITEAPLLGEHYHPQHPI